MSHRGGSSCRNRRRIACSAALITCVFLTVTTGLAAGTSDPAAGTSRHPWLVCNRTQPQSVECARFYAKARGIDETRIVALDLAAAETIPRKEFQETIAEPLGRILPETRDAAVRVVLMRGVPVRVAPANPETAKLAMRDKEHASKADGASVDSEIAALALPPAPAAGGPDNPLFGKRSVDAVQGFHPILVGRIDGPDWRTARRLVEDAVWAEQNGLRGGVVLDHAAMSVRHGSAYERGDQWLEATGDQLREQGRGVFEDREGACIQDDAGFPRPVAFYFGWYAPHATGPFRRGDFRFARGAIACHIHSLSATTLRTRSQRWVGPLLDRGAAVALGNVYEPFLSHSTHLDLFVARLLEGRTVAEASLLATPRLSWMNVTVGDPLYRPFPPPDLSTEGEPSSTTPQVAKDPESGASAAPPDSNSSR